MAIPASTLLQSVVQELNVPEEELLKQGIRSFLEGRLREIKAEIFQLHGQYSVSSVEEMEARYEDGTLEEADSWRDFQRLDHLEFERDRLVRLCDSLV